MWKSYRFGLLVAALLLFSALLPTSKSEAAVVFSNMAEPNGGPCAGSQNLALIFDVPVGQDYRVNSVTLRLAFLGPVFIRIHSDNAGLRGPQVVDLGTANTTGLNDYTFTPTGADTLTNGGRYWLVLEQPTTTVFWCTPLNGVAPTGVFNFVSNGYGLAYTTYPDPFKVSIDADALAVIPPPSAGMPVPACSDTDSRLNSICAEPEQTAAIYCRADGSIDVYGIIDSAGWLAFRTTQSEIDAVGIPAENTLIGQTGDGRIRLYRLSTGEFQVNAPMWDTIRGNLPDGYIFTFGGCS